MKSAITIFIMATTTAAYAQWQWRMVDSVTSGNFDDHNPQLDHGGLGIWRTWAPFEWLVFERQSDTQSAVCAMKVESCSVVPPLTVPWDSSVTIISSGPSYLLKKYPDICTDFKTINAGVGDSVIAQTLAVWLEMDTRYARPIDSWDVYISYSTGNENVWSIPQLLTNNGEEVKVRPLSDSSFILIWKTDRTLMFTTFWNGIASSPDTLIVTNYDSTEFDCEQVAYPQPTLAWTEKDSLGKVDCLVAQITSLSPVVLSRFDTLSSNGNISNPKFMGYYPRTLTFNVKLGSRLKAVLASRYFDYWLGPWQQVDLAFDSLSDNLNAVTASPPMVLTSSNRSGNGVDTTEITYGLFAWERRSNSDTVIVFMDFSTDTVKSAGYNSKPAISTYAFAATYYEMFPCVWESNRTGRPHIYGRVGLIGGDAVNQPAHRDPSFELLQNYPNPFNPTTTINYRLSTVSQVTLRVYDILGRVVTTLVNGKQTPGEHSATFDAKGYSSGVYFCRLMAGSVIETRKMLFVK